METGGEIVYVAVGANLGDREATLARTVRAIEGDPDLRLLAASSVYETPPVGPSGQSPYLNAVLELRVRLAPLELLHRLQAIELALGRDRGPDAVRWGPRVIDLDILFFGDRCIELPELIIPHARAHERSFVMTPLAEIAPDLTHPRLGQTALALAAGRADREDVRVQPRPTGWPRAWASS